EVEGHKCVTPEESILWQPEQEVEGRVYPCTEAEDHVTSGVKELFGPTTEYCFGLKIFGSRLYRYISNYYGAHGEIQEGVTPVEISGDGTETGRLESWVGSDIECPEGLDRAPGNPAK